MKNRQMEQEKEDSYEEGDGLLKKICEVEHYEIKSKSS